MKNAVTKLKFSQFRNGRTSIIRVVTTGGQSSRYTTLIILYNLQENNGTIQNFRISIGTHNIINH